MDEQSRSDSFESDVTPPSQPLEIAHKRIGQGRSVLICGKTYSRRNLGLFSALMCGLWGGSCLVPMHYAKGDTSGLGYVISFSTGALGEHAYKMKLLGTALWQCTNDAFSSFIAQKSSQLACGLYGMHINWSDSEVQEKLLRSFHLFTAESCGFLVPRQEHYGPLETLVQLSQCNTLAKALATRHRKRLF